MKHTLDGITGRLDTLRKLKMNGFGDTAIETSRIFFKLSKAIMICESIAFNGDLQRIEKEV